MVPENCCFLETRQQKHKVDKHVLSPNGECSLEHKKSLRTRRLWVLKRKQKAVAILRDRKGNTRTLRYIVLQYESGHRNCLSVKQSSEAVKKEEGENITGHH